MAKMRVMRDIKISGKLHRKGEVLDLPESMFSVDGLQVVAWHEAAKELAGVLDKPKSLEDLEAELARLRSGAA